MTTRRPLPQRRHSETFEIEFGGLRAPYTVTVGYYADNKTPGEVFIGGGKSGEQSESIARDGAVLLSMALQYGVPLETIGHAITRNPRGEPQTIVGAVVDHLLTNSRQGAN